VPLAFLIIGAVLIIVALRNTYSQLGTLLVQDFTGQGGTGGASFLVWLAAIGAIAALGYIPAIRTPARYLLILVVLGMFIANKGVFSQAQQAISGGIPSVTVTAASSTPTEAQLPAAIPVQITGTTGSSGTSTASAVGTATSALKAIPVIGGLL
jgi:hypothetical protein